MVKSSRRIGLIGGVAGLIALGLGNGAIGCTRHPAIVSSSDHGLSGGSQLDELNLRNDRVSGEIDSKQKEARDLFDQANVSWKLGAKEVGDHQFAAARELMRQCFRDEFENLDDILSKTASSNDPGMRALHEQSEQVRNQYQAMYAKFLARGLTDGLH